MVGPDHRRMLARRRLDLYEVLREAEVYASEVQYLARTEADQKLLDTVSGAVNQVEDELNAMGIRPELEEKL